jgi:hypothetical protein
MAAAMPVAAGAAAGGPGGLFDRLEAQFKLPKGLLDSVWATESSRGRNMMSPKGAEGHFQFMPGTAKQYGVKNPYDLVQSATGAAHMYSDLLKQTGGSLPAALAAYNWGIGNLQNKGMGAAPAETRGYITKVMAGMGYGGGLQPIPSGTEGPMAPTYASMRRAGGGAAGTNGKVLVEVVLANMPAGSKANTKTTGSVVATTRVREPMLTANMV